MTPISELPLPPSAINLAAKIRNIEDWLQRQIEELADQRGDSVVTLFKVRHKYIPFEMFWRMETRFWPLFYTATFRDFVKGQESDTWVYDITVTTCDPEAANPSYAR